jgi:hypothetical protein
MIDYHQQEWPTPLFSNTVPLLRPAEIDEKREGGGDRTAVVSS